MRAPTLGKESAQLPAATEAEHEAPSPSLTVTVPVGVPAPGETDETRKLTETD